MTTYLRIAFLAITFISLTSLYAQRGIDPPAQLEWGPENQEPPKTLLGDIFAITPDAFYGVRRKIVQTPDQKEKVYLEMYDKSDMKLKRSRELDMKYKGKIREFEKVIMLNDKMHVFTSYNNQSQKNNYLFVQSVRPTSLVVSKNLEMIASSPARNLVNEGSFDFYVSQDSSKLLLYSDLPYRKGDPEQFKLWVYDDKMEKIWERSIILPYRDNQFSVEEYQVDNEGNVYLLGVQYIDGVVNRRAGKPNYRYVVLAYNKTGEEVKEYQIELERKFITDLTFRIDREGNLVCSGFYSEKGNYSIKGTCFFRIDTETKQLYNTNTREFDFDFVTEYLPKGQLKRAVKAEANNDVQREAEIFRVSLNDLILRSDGGAVLVAEQFFIEEWRQNDFYNPYWGGWNRWGTPMGGLGRQVRYFYNYNDIIVVNIKPTGEIEWSVRIPKAQETIDDGGYFSSYAMATVRDKLYFIFNDDARNYSNDSDRLYSFGGGSRSVITLAEISQDGRLDMYPLFNNRDASIVTRPKVCKQIGLRQMAVYGERGRRYRFGSLNFDKQ